MASPLSAYTTLGNLQSNASNKGAELGFGMSKSISNERRGEEKKREERENKRGIGRLVGGGTSLLASLLLAPLTGGLSIPLQMLIAGGMAGGASMAGQKIAGGDKKIKTGMWDIDADKNLNRAAKDSVLASAGTDALSAAAFAGAGGLTKYLGKVTPTSNVPYVNQMDKVKQSIIEKQRNATGLYDWQQAWR